MKKNIRWITETAVLMALLICLQWLGSNIPTPLVKQLITGTCVNCVLAIAALYSGTGSSMTIALISPILAFFVGISQPITVIPIMAGNACYVLLLRLISGNSGNTFWRQPVALAVAAGAKFAVLYILVVKTICGFASGLFMGKMIGDQMLLGPKMLQPKNLPLMFSWPQLVTAICGGIIALCILPVLRKALHKDS